MNSWEGEVLLLGMAFDSPEARLGGREGCT